MSSIARHGNRGQSNYVSAKAALAANTTTWAREFAPFGIRLCGVAPGMVETPMTQGMNQKARDAIVASIPVEAVNSVFFPFIEHVQSIGGDPGRANVNHTRFNLDMTTPWTPEWWTAIESKLIVDWTKSGKTGMNLEFEVGRKLGPHYRTWVRGGAGLWGDGVFGSYDWIAEMGIRYMY